MACAAVMPAILSAAAVTGADAIHPGYGFLSENARFAEMVEAHGLTFIGPRPEHLRAFGLKHTAREIATASGVPLLPGTGVLADAAEALAPGAWQRMPSAAETRCCATCSIRRAGTSLRR